MTQEFGVPSIANAKLSILISNYNYAEFVAAAVNSALNVDWPSKEVIVVDNDSTDGSRAVIESFGDRIVAVFKEHGGQYTSSNTAFARATGDIIIFLDADDVLAPSIMREAASQWTPSTVKVQVLMQTIDANGNRLPSVIPQLKKTPTPDLIRMWQRATTYYPGPPASGNIYARRMLEQIFPIVDEGCQSTDMYCISAAPFFGDVTTINKPLCGYRIHGRNMGAASGLDMSQMRHVIGQALAQCAWVRKIAARRGATVSSAAPGNSLWLLCYRVTSYKFGRSEHPIPSDNTLRLFWDSLRACVTPQGNGRTTALLVLWVLAVLLAPKALSKHFALWRFSPQSRPRFLLDVLRRLRLRARAGNEPSTLSFI